MAEAVIFDLDGVLVDSEHYKFKAWQAAFGSIGVEFDWEEFNQEFVIKGASFVEFLEKRDFKGEFVEENVRPIANDLFLRSIEEDICLMPGAAEILERLQEFPLGLASNSYYLYVEKFVEKFDFDKWFKAIANGSEVERLKPHPDVLLLVADRIGVDSKDCVVIEDAPKGIVAAKNAGMKAIAVPTKDTQFGDFDEADIVLPNLDEVTVELVNMI